MKRHIPELRFKLRVIAGEGVGALLAAPCITKWRSKQRLYALPIRLSFPFRLALLFFVAFMIDGTLGGCRRGGPAEETKSDEASKQPVVVETSTATRTPIETTVAAQGLLTPAQGASARVAAAIPARIVSIRVKEGDQVAAGEEVAVLDYRSQEALARSAAAALRASEAQARQAEAASRAAAADQSSAVRTALLALDAARIDRDNSQKQAGTALQAAETDLRKTRAGARPQEMNQANLAVTLARATRDRAAAELERVRFLFDKGIAARRQLDDAETALQVSEATLESAKQQASLVQAGARPEDLKAAELKVQAARETLQSAQISGDAKMEQARSALRQAENGRLQVEAKRQEAQAMRATTMQKRADLTAAQASAGYGVIHAPISGTVVRRALNPGDMADPATPILEIADIRSLNLLASLPAEQGVRISPGMTARVSPSDAPERILAGRVISVGQVDPQANLLSVRISVSNPTGSIRSGAFATARIVVSSRRDAVVIPRQAVVNREGKPVVFVVDSGGVAHAREVQTGVEQGDQIEIVRGLKPGERVVRVGQYELADGAKVTETESQGKTAPGAKE